MVRFRDEAMSLFKKNVGAVITMSVFTTGHFYLFSVSSQIANANIYIIYIYNILLVGSFF